MVGVVDDLDHLTTPALQAPGDLLIVLGATPVTLGAGEYAAMRAGRELGPVPPLDLAAEARVLDLVREGIRAGWVRAAHDVSDGGLAVALAEMCIAGELGAELAWEAPGRADLALFGEGGGRIVMAIPADARARVERRAAELDVAAAVLGAVSAVDALEITLRAGTPGGREETRAGATMRLSLPVVALRARWEEAIPWIMR
jgi:phosphoribosylformylglycinamidine synthase